MAFWKLYALAVKDYRQYCTVARGLEVIGDRWALLIVRELLFGPRRYADLLDGLPGIGTNVLATRLRELEAGGILARRRLPPPTPVTLYELTGDGRDLRPVLEALSRWGLRRLGVQRPDDAGHPNWFLFAVAAAIDPTTLTPGDVYQLRLDDQPMTLSVARGHVEAAFGDASHATATITADVSALLDLASRRQTRDALQREGRITVAGDPAAAHRLLDTIESLDWRSVLPPSPPGQRLRPR
jgi:DNA-binding HxlR family transcriptional regulator